MRRRALAGLGAMVGSLTAATALLIGTSIGHATPGPSEAYGAYISGIIDPPQPHVQSTDGTTQSDSLVELPDNPLLGLKAATVTAGDSEASVELANVEILPIDNGLPPELQEGFEQLQGALCEGVPSTEELPEELAPLTDLLDPGQVCDGNGFDAPAVLSADLITVACEGDTGTFDVANLRLLGQPIDVPGPEANTQIPLDPLAHITFNKQFTDERGFTTQALAVEVGGGELEIVLASATCGEAAAEPEVPQAPKPTPTEADLPVTG
ncbi:choice-of-anchor P family protein [Haloechinothrix sp. LS1_15]|uniref:choice-of-anchor P family protein n=1 Tax=Haloechinothrix sp. LS1_15 TaxID=2652248 RepID=UPI002945C340|nr:choice-of-anchor P family protein [Haloechinothrix sp. LS1_15]MDV6013940.1 hypothetical protein [Haloechinothrix sp. LS1_15]